MYKGRSGFASSANPSLLHYNWYKNLSLRTKSGNLISVVIPVETGIY